jgi:hypothetical protein
MRLRVGQRPIPPHLAQTRKLTVYLLSAPIIVAVVVWIGVLLWGLLAVSQWLLDMFSSFWN